MTARSFNWLPVILLTVIAAVSFWLLRLAQDDARPAAKPTQGMDFWAENFTVRRFDKDGQLQDTLKATRLTHNSADDSSVLSEPFVTTVGNPALTVVAKQALVGRDATTIEFIGDVEAVRETKKAGKGGAKGPVRIRSQRMTVFPDSQIAQGNSPVRIEQLKSVVTGSSFKTNGGTGVTVLNGNVRATIIRNNS